MLPWLLPFYSFDAERKCARWFSKLAKWRLRYLHKITKPLLQGGAQACSMRLHGAAHSHVRGGKRFLNGRKPALPLCYTTGKTGQNRRLRKMNGVHTPFIFRKWNRKRVDSMHQRQKRRAPSLLRKVPLAQLSETPIPGRPGNARPEQRYRRRRHSAHGGFQP